MTDTTNVTIEVDGRELQVPKGTLLWEACHANDIEIPIFCYHTKLGPVGACRTCLVEQEGMSKPITACSTPVADGMTIRTRSPLAQKSQRAIFEFLLANHPLDCPICDKGGECPLQDQTFAFGPGASRYVEPKRHHVKPIALGPTIALDRERCVLCWRCVRFCSEIAEDNSIVLLDRGDHTVVGTFEDEPYVSNFSGNVVELCPVGALTSRKQRFNFRPWELSSRPSVCPHCPMGCNINVNVRKNDEVIRFLSRDNPEVDDSWLCDRGRFNFEFINSPERLRAPLIRQAEGFVQSSWDDALELIAGRLGQVLEESGPGAVAGVASPRLPNEDLFVFKRFMTDIVGTAALDHYPRSQMVLGPAELEALRRLDRTLMPISHLDRARTILLLAADPSEREPVIELRLRLAVNRHGARLVVVHPDEIVLSSKASATLSYRRARLADVARSLAVGVMAGRSGGPAPDVPGDLGLDPEALQVLVDNFLREGPVAVLYDDAFDGVTDRGDALAAVAQLVDALGQGAEVGTLPMLDSCNSMGARDLDILPAGSSGGMWGPSVVDRLLDPKSDFRAALLLGSNLARDVAGMADRLSKLDLLVVQELFLTDTARLADVVLPAASFAERVGTFTNTERRVQALNQAVPSPGVARPDWQILVDLSQYFGRGFDYSLPADVWDDIRRAVPAYASIAYADIGPRGVLAGALQPV